MIMSIVGGGMIQLNPSASCSCKSGCANHDTNYLNGYDAGYGTLAPGRGAEGSSAGGEM